MDDVFIDEEENGQENERNLRLQRGDRDEFGFEYSSRNSISASRLPASFIHRQMIDASG